MKNTNLISNSKSIVNIRLAFELANTFKLPAIGLLALTWVGSFIMHPNFKSFEVGFSNHGQVEFFPDFYVTYSCQGDFASMEGLDMDTEVENQVTVNYGGYGRRRGARNFKCK
jgi:hypothetical protein